MSIWQNTASRYSFQVTALHSGGEVKEVREWGKVEIVEVVRKNSKAQIILSIHPKESADLQQQRQKQDGDLTLKKTFHDHNHMRLEVNTE